MLIRALASFSLFWRSTSPTRSCSGRRLALTLRPGAPELALVTGRKLHSARAASCLARSSSSLAHEVWERVGPLIHT